MTIENETEINEADLREDQNGSHTMEPEYNAYSNDACMLLGVAESGVLGNPVIVVIGAADDDRDKYSEVNQNSRFSSLGAADRIEFLASAIADLQVMLDEIKKADE